MKWFAKAYSCDKNVIILYQNLETDNLCDKVLINKFSNQILSVEKVNIVNEIKTNNLIFKNKPPKAKINGYIRNEEFVYLYYITNNNYILKSKYNYETLQLMYFYYFKYDELTEKEKISIKSNKFNNRFLHVYLSVNIKHKIIKKQEKYIDKR